MAARTGSPRYPCRARCKSFRPIEPGMIPNSHRAAPKTAPARHIDLFRQSAALLHIVMVAADPSISKRRAFSTQRWSAASAFSIIASRFVGWRNSLRPVYRFRVIVKNIRFLIKIRRSRDGAAFNYPAFLLRRADKIGADGVTDPARTGVQYDPYLIGFIQTDSIKWLPVPSVPVCL